MIKTIVCGTLLGFTACLSLRALDIGEWDGKTESAELSGPYEDRLQAEVPFGRRSYFLTPWRSYMDTWPASRFLDCLGINFNVDENQAEAVAQILGETGIRSGRIEMGWGNFAYEDATRLPDWVQKRSGAILKALQKYGIRPLILLNANSGWPCPISQIKVKLVKPAEAGAREIFLENTSEVKPGYTGFRGMAYQVGFPLIVACDASGRCELSAPLAKALNAGAVDLFRFKYQPFCGAVLPDGKPNPAAQETVEGWKLYVKVISDFAKSTLGTDGAADAGFDLEVWNEYTFGSEFLDGDHNYFNPPRVCKEKISYSRYGLKREGSEIILPITIDFVKDPANNLPGVRVISGFANQRPWDSGADMWPGQTGFSRHYYTGLNPGTFNGNSGVLTPETEPVKNSGPLNALGKPDGTPDKKDWHTVFPGTFFIPSLRVGMPEIWHYAYKTELMTRETQPFPNPMPGHFRYAHPGTGQPAQVWMTEFNMDRQPFAEAIMKESGCNKDDPKLAALLHHVGAKTTLRSFVFLAHKGVHTINMYAIHESDFSLGVAPDAFFKVLTSEKNKLTDAVRAESGPQLRVLKNVADLMKTAKPIDTARPLQVAKIVEHQPRLVFKGDGSPEHPDRWHRDDFAVLPYQLADNQFAVACYVVTRDLSHVWNKDRGALDPVRYDMPEQTFDLTLNNIRGEGATAELYDPFSAAKTSPEILAKSATSITVRMKCIDTPRFLLLNESKPGPLVRGVKLTNENGIAKLAFETNVNVAPKLSWGARPERIKSGAKDLPAGTAHRAEIGALAADEGVQITVECDGLLARWPLWGDDTRGVATFAKAIAAFTPPSRELEFPPLTQEKQFSEFSSTLPANLKWEGDEKHRSLKTADGAVIELRFISGDLNSIRTLLPAAAALDSVNLQAQPWNGAAAWKGEFRLEAAAHPGVTDLHQLFFIAPLKQGFVVLSVRGTPDAMSKSEKIAGEIARGVTFK